MSPSKPQPGLAKLPISFEGLWALPGLPGQQSHKYADWFHQGFMRFNSSCSATHPFLSSLLLFPLRCNYSKLWSLTPSLRLPTLAHLSQQSTLRKEKLTVCTPRLLPSFKSCTFFLPCCLHWTSVATKWCWHRYFQKLHPSVNAAFHVLPNSHPSIHFSINIVLLLHWFASPCA